MNKRQLEELKNIVSELDLNNEVDNLEAEECNACCLYNNGGVEPPKHETQQKIQDEIQP